MINTNYLSIMKKAIYGDSTTEIITTSNEIQQLSFSQDNLPILGKTVGNTIADLSANIGVASGLFVGTLDESRAMTYNLDTYADVSYITRSVDTNIGINSKINTYTVIVKNETATPIDINALALVSYLNPNHTLPRSCVIASEVFETITIKPNEAYQFTLTIEI